MSSSKDLQNAISQFIQTFPQFKEKKQDLTISNLSNGLVFAYILQEIPNLNLQSTSLNKTAKTWVQKLSNLKRILEQIQDYFQKTYSKGLKTNDVNLIDIAKQNSVTELLKFFEVIMSVLIQSPKKDDYIQKIMSLDQKSQAIFVSIIQNGMQSRLTSLNEAQANKMIVLIQQLSQQNNTLKQQFAILEGANQDLTNQNKQLKNRIQEIMDQLANQQDTQKSEQQKQTQEKITHDSHQIQRLKNMIQNLKDKLMQTAVEHEMQISKLKQEYSLIEAKAHHAQQLEDTLYHYKQKYEQSSKQLKKCQNYEKQKIQLIKKNQEKQNTIKRLNEKIEVLNGQKNDMQIQQTYLKMELQKKQVRFKQLQKQVKNRLTNMNSQSGITGAGFSADLSSLQQTLKAFSLDDSISGASTIKQKQFEIQQTRLTELQKQNRILMKKAQNLETTEKKKNSMQKAFEQLQKRRRQQIHVLLTAFAEYKQQNQKLFEEIKSSKTKIK